VLSPWALPAIAESIAATNILQYIAGKEKDLVHLSDQLMVISIHFVIHRSLIQSIQAEAEDVSLHCWWSQAEKLSFDALSKAWELKIAYAIWWKRFTETNFMFEWR
jgi:hypothetical protein